MIPTFVQNAIDVACFYEEGEFYKIGRRLTGKDPSNYKYDSIIPVDMKNTGMLFLNRKYSEGTHQFLELKHQLSLSDVTLVTNYISYFSVYKRYQELYGVTGTLGNDIDLTFLKEKLGLNCRKIPSHKESSTRYCSFLVCEDEDKWLQEVVENTIYVAESGQAVLVICKDMNTAETIYKELVDVRKYNKEKVQPYWRDDTQKLNRKVIFSLLDQGNYVFDFQPLEPGDLIISTALASRGTDIAVSERVNNCPDGGGGLHVLITFLPPNSRVERQITGRTGRKGSPGSTRTILCREILREELGEVEDEKDKIYDRRDFREAQRVETLKESLEVIEFKEELFQIFCDKLQEFKNDRFQPSYLEQTAGETDYDLSKQNRRGLLNTLKREKRQLDFSSCVDALKEEWGLWLAQNVGSRSNINPEDMQKYKEDLKTFLDSKMKELCEGKCNNFYHKINHAKIRSLLFDEMDADFVRNTWENIQSEIDSRDLERFGSAIYYNRACFTLKTKPKDCYGEVLDLLEKARQSTKKRVEELVVEGVIQSFLNGSAPFKTHVGENEDAIVNLIDQNNKTMEMLNTFDKHVEEVIEKLKGFKNEDVNVTVEMKDIRELFKKNDDPIMDNEVNCFVNDGHMMIFNIEKKWTFSWAALWVSVLGVAQVIGGGLLCVFSAGSFSSIGLDLIMDGISDCIAGIKGLVTGTFSLTAWLIQKAISLVISVVSFGLAKGVKWIKNGCNVSRSGMKTAGRKFLQCFTKVGWKQSAKQSLKYAGKQIIEQVALDLIGEGFEKILEKAVEEAVESFKPKVLEQLKNNSEVRDSLVYLWKNQDLRVKKPPSFDQDINILIENITAELFNDLNGGDQFDSVKTALQKYGGYIRQTTDKVIRNHASSRVKKTVKIADLLLKSLEIVNIIKDCAELGVFITTSCSTISKDLKKGLLRKTVTENHTSEYKGYIDDEMRNFASNYTEQILFRIKSELKNIINGTVRPIAMRKASKFVQKRTKIYDNEGYFRAKQMKKKQANVEGSTNSTPEEETLKEKIIDIKKGKDADEIDVKAVAEETGKKIVIETINEKGEVISTDTGGTGSGKDVIRLRCVKTKNKDGSYSGHYEAVVNGEPIPNDGDNNTCFYQAVIQHDAKIKGENINYENLKKDADKLRENSLNGLNPDQIRKMYENKYKYHGQMGAAGKYDLSGGGGRLPTKKGKDKRDNQRRMDERARNMKLKDATTKHYQERLESLGPLHDEFKRLFPQNTQFEDVFEEKATHQDGKGRNDPSKKPTNPDLSDFESSDMMDDFSTTHAAHIVGLGLKPDAHKYLNKGMDTEELKSLKSLLAKCNLTTDYSNQNLERSIDRGIIETFKEHCNGPSRSTMEWADDVYSEVKKRDKDNHNFKYLRGAHGKMEESYRKKAEE